MIINVHLNSDVRMYTMTLLWWNKNLNSHFSSVLVGTDKIWLVSLQN